MTNGQILVAACVASTVLTLGACTYLYMLAANMSYMGVS